jgi:hypothetical protein
MTSTKCSPLRPLPLQRIRFLDRAPELTWVPFAVCVSRGFSAQPLLNFIKSQVGTDFEIYKPKPWGLIITAPFLFVLSSC